MAQRGCHPPSSDAPKASLWSQFMNENSFKLHRLFLLFISYALLESHEGLAQQFRITNPKIVFLSNRDKPIRHFDIYVMNVDGGEQTNVTNHFTSIRSNSNPQFSPDQKKILFLAFEAGKRTLQLMNHDGSGRIDLTEVDTDAPDPQFSPDGSKIVFVSTVDGRRQIYIVNSDGTQRKNLSSNSRDEFDPSFSPDGSKTVFVSRRTGASSSSICQIKSNGFNRVQLTDERGSRRHPRFSPDGAKIVFSLSRDGDDDIFIMNSDGTNDMNLTRSRGFDTDPRFSPDGSTIVFVSNRRGIKFRDIFIMNVNGRDLKNLSHELRYVNQHPRFSPDGTKIVFESAKFGDCEIYTVDVDGRNLTNLTNSPKWDQTPAF